jgi:hypothetical protein
MLRYRTVVSRTSSAFKILDDACADLEEVNNTQFVREIRQEKARGILSFVSSALRQTLGVNNSPDDLDEHGNGIMHVWFSDDIAKIVELIRIGLSHLAWSATGCLGWNNLEAVTALIDTCVARGVSSNEMDANGL